MSILVILLALSLLVFLAYQGFSVILFAPVAAGLAILLTHPAWLLPFLSGIYMEAMVRFINLYFPIFLLGAIFGKLIETSGFARSIIHAMVRALGPQRAILAIVLVCAVLTYGGVSLFVVVFAVYPFGAELFRLSAIPKRLLPAAIALGAFTFTMDALPGSPQIQNIVPTAFFGTTVWAAPWLGIAGGVFIFVGGMVYLERQRRRSMASGEGYGAHHQNEPLPMTMDKLPPAWLALVPLVLVVGLNWAFTLELPATYGPIFLFSSAGLNNAPPLDLRRLWAIWAVAAALVVAIVFIVAVAFHRVRFGFQASISTAITGAMLAAVNTGSEYGFGAVVAALPGFHSISQFLLGTIHNPLIGVAVASNVLAGITGSASGGLSLALAMMGKTYLGGAVAAGIPPAVLHRVAAMASGGMDTLPHNGAVVTLLTVSGLTHRESYRGIFAMTVIKTLGVAFVISIYALFRLN
jgi:H+/gluconate symporter-like permease